MAAQFKNIKDDIQDDIVISGISGRLPRASNIEEFKKNLFEGIDCVTNDDSRWPPGLYGLPTNTGNVKNVTSFDATFFGVHPKQTDAMDPQLRILLELTFEAIVDAGFNPASLRGSNTGVFVATSNLESEIFVTNNLNSINGYNLLGCSRNMAANRISYTFDFKGPSFAIDTACSSSFYAIHQALSAIRNGECDAAIVGGANLLLHPFSSLPFHRSNMLSQDGKCKVFDADGNGYARAEALVTIFLQKSKDARRVYASVIKTKTNMGGYQNEGLTYPNGEMQYKLIREVYDEIAINPADIAYVEANATGSKIVDSLEANSIASIFCKNRKGPLLIGSVKSNIGHPWAASGLCAIAKVLLAMEHGVIPPNLHYKIPNPNIPGLVDGRLKVVDKLTPWNGGLVALNSFGLGGANGHIILRNNPKAKSSNELKSELPKLIAVSGRTKEAVNYMLDGIQKHKQDDEFVALLHEVHAENIPGHLVRGCEIMGNPDSRQVDDFNGSKRPIWFVFPGIGSQWEGMGRHLIRIDTFRRSLERCAAVLKPLGIDLMDLILHGTDETYSNISNCFVSIAAIQIGLVDLLTLLGIHPDGIVGHSFGELGCAYADGAFTAEQMILTAYWRGKSIQEGSTERGAMAAVSLSWEETAKRCPPNVYPACNNSSDSVTISGEANAIHKFVKELEAENIFVKVVNSSDCALHSKYIAPAGPILREALKKIIPNPKKRSSRWISSSVPQSKWDSPLAQFSSAEYHVNNVLSPVLFHEATTHMPGNVIAIEIGPHCLLQAILRRSLSSDVTNIGLQKRNHKDNLEYFLKSIGTLYNAGAQPRISKLYPPVNYPVGRGTAMINSLIKWDHSIEWPVLNYYSLNRSSQHFIDVDLSDEENAFISGHKINGTITYPVIGYIVLVWKTFAQLKDMDPENTPVIFENVLFHRAVVIPEKSSVKFMINIFSGNGDFEVCEDQTIVASGRIRSLENVDKKESDSPPVVPTKKSGVVVLTMEDVYRELGLRGYDYTGVFQAIKTADDKGISGELNWCNNWISFINSMFQFCILGSNIRELYLPTRIQYLSINPILHMKKATEFSKEGCVLPIYNYKNINCLKSGGIEMKGLRVSLEQKSLKTQMKPKLEQYTFIPYENNHPLVRDSTEKAQLHVLNVLLQIVCENLSSSKMNVIEVANNRKSEALLTPDVFEILYDKHQITNVDLQLITTSPDNYASMIDQFAVKIVKNTTSARHDSHVVLAADVLSNKCLNDLKSLSAVLRNGGFVILEESGEYNKNLLKETDLKCVAIQFHSKKTYVLLKKVEQKAEPIIIQITEKNFSWLKNVKAALKKAQTEGKELLLVNQGEEQFGIVGFMNCLRFETGGINARYVFIQDQKAPKFSLSEPFYAQQMSKQVMANVLKGGQWGSYRYFHLEQRNDATSRKVEHVFANTLVPGDLSSLRWIDNSLNIDRSEKQSNKETCSVYYVSLNFKDIMSVTGEFAAEVLPNDMASQNCILGLEISGRNNKGQRVMGLVSEQGLATTVTIDPLLMWEVPDNWTLEEASSIPVAYATSYYALFVCARLKSTESILIHSGCSGVGLASIAIALHAGCKVFTTVESQEKRNFLKKTFPRLTDRNIGSSNDTSFERLIMEETNANGVDVILNSLTQELLQATVKCLALEGRFIDIGKYSKKNVSNIGMFMFLKNTSYYNITLDSLVNANASDKTLLKRLVSEGIQNGAVRPLPLKIFLENQIEEAFRYKASGKHIGKISVKIRDEENQKIVPRPSPKTLMAISRTHMRPEKSYILVGGLGGFGLEFMNWIIERGAKNVVLTSRSGIRTGYQSLCVQRWQESGVNVVISTADCTTLAGAEKLIKDSNKIAPVGGIFNTAAVLNDGLIEHLNEDNFKTVALPKIDATKNLDHVSRKYCSSLDYFVVFSSTASGRGNMGQTNYGFANSAMERIVERRTSDGLPGLAIQMGALRMGADAVLENTKDNKTKINDTLLQHVSNYLSTMDTLLRQSHPVLSCAM